MKLITKRLTVAILTLLTLGMSVAEAARVGPAGPRGPIGVTGPRGPIGATGLQGPIGIDGPTGPTGAHAVNGTQVGQTLVWDGVEWTPVTKIHNIGDSYQGGVIFWVNTDGTHGLISARADQHVGIQWYNNTDFQTHATANGLYAGAKNTEVIVATQTTFGLDCGELTVPSYCNNGASTPTGDYAALVAANYSVRDDGTTACTGATDEICYGDWYLPSKVELNLLYKEKSVVGDFAVDDYWSSTEHVVSSLAWSQYFSNGIQKFNSKDYASIRVRAVRAF